MQIYSFFFVRIQHFIEDVNNSGVYFKFVMGAEVFGQQFYLLYLLVVKSLGCHANAVIYYFSNRFDLQFEQLYLFVAVFRLYRRGRVVIVSFLDRDVLVLIFMRYHNSVPSVSVASTYMLC